MLGLPTALGAVRFAIDDLIKIRQARNLGLNKTAKRSAPRRSGDLGVLALRFRSADGLTPAAELYVREIATVTLPPAVFVRSAS